MKCKKTKKYQIVKRVKIVTSVEIKLVRNHYNRNRNKYPIDITIRDEYDTNIE